jgi:hypothetical protein
MKLPKNAWGTALAIAMRASLLGAGAQAPGEDSAVRDAGVRPRLPDRPPAART